VDWVYIKDHEAFSGVREIILNRTEKRNALTFDMWQTLKELIRTCDADPEVRVVILRGSDASAFAAGADISEFRHLRYDKSSFEIYQQATDGATRAIHSARPVTIAAIRGLCYGGGVQIASACDFRICDTTARFAITPAKLGFVYGLYETRLLMRIVGEARTKELLFTGREFGAEEALNWGFVNCAVPPASYEETLHQFVANILQASGLSQAGMKQIIHRIANGQTADDDDTRALVCESIESADYKEGVTAFLEKRKPRFYPKTH
jgi:enoyl-CoA hydratase/carnithine racemase